MYRTALCRTKVGVVAQPIVSQARTADSRCCCCISRRVRREYSALNASLRDIFPKVSGAALESLSSSPSGMQQLRWSSSKKRKKQLHFVNKQDDPFSVLGVSRSETYTAVKRTFLQIAMKYHPDTAVAGNEAERDESKNLFLAARKAFEAMVSGPDGLAILKTEAADFVEEDLDQWFKTETGYDMPFMDAATMKEVAEMTESVGGGLDRDGGMWTLARMVADTVKSGGDGRSILQLEAGSVRDPSVDGVLRRKRRR